MEKEKRRADPGGEEVCSGAEIESAPRGLWGGSSLIRDADELYSTRRATSIRTRYRGLVSRALRVAVQNC